MRVCVYIQIYMHIYTCIYIVILYSISSFELLFAHACQQSSCRHQSSWERQKTQDLKFIDAQVITTKVS